MRFFSGHVQGLAAVLSVTLRASGWCLHDSALNLRSQAAKVSTTVADVKVIQRSQIHGHVGNCALGQSGPPHGAAARFCTERQGKTPCLSWVS